MPIRYHLFNAADPSGERIARDRVRKSWVADAQQSALQDRYRPGKAAGIGEGGQVADCLCG